MWPPPAVVDILTALERPLRDDLRWTTAGQWHITVAFVGEVDDGDVMALARGVERAVVPWTTGPDRRADIEVVLGPKPVHVGPGVLALPVGGLDDVAAAVRRHLGQRGFSLEDRPFRGHLTLARARRGRRVPTDAVVGRVEARWPLDSLAVVSSRLGPGGSRYETVALTALR